MKFIPSCLYPPSSQEKAKWNIIFYICFLIGFCIFLGLSVHYLIINPFDWKYFPKCTVTGYQTECYSNTYCKLKVISHLNDECPKVLSNETRTYNGTQAPNRILLVASLRYPVNSTQECWSRDCETYVDFEILDKGLEFSRIFGYIMISFLSCCMIGTLIMIGIQIYGYGISQSKN